MLVARLNCSIRTVTLFMFLICRKHHHSLSQRSATGAQHNQTLTPYTEGNTFFIQVSKFFSTMYRYVANMGWMSTVWRITSVKFLIDLFPL
jgi:hypothetical protein